MEVRSFDFAVLGDTQPEGLYIASGLARRGYRVVIVPSQNLGELPTQAPWPVNFPEQIGNKRLDDLLFKVGFFRLEDSGLMPVEYQQQVLLPKHRLSFDGTSRRWELEVRREFPQIADRLMALKSGSKKNLRVSALHQVQQLKRQNQDFKDWVDMAGMEGRPPEADLGDRRWLNQLERQDSKNYRVNPKLGQPFCQFLLENCKRWGASIFDDNFEIKARLSSFELAPQWRAKRLIINSLGAARFIGKLRPDLFSNQIEQWLYYDRVQVSLDTIPEPLGEFSFLKSVSSKQAQVLYLSRDPARGKAILTVGTWLNFIDSREWKSQIQEGRKNLRRLLPFLSEEVFSTLPESLELTEMKGECVRRGEIERLVFSSRGRSELKRFARRISPLSFGKQIFFSLPYLERMKDRRSSLSSCLQLLERFEKRRGVGGGTPEARV